MNAQGRQADELQGKLPLRPHRLRGRGRHRVGDAMQLFDLQSARTSALVRATREAAAVHAGERSRHVHLQQAEDSASFLPGVWLRSVRRGLPLRQGQAGGDQRALPGGGRPLAAQGRPLRRTEPLIFDHQDTKNTKKRVQKALVFLVSWWFKAQVCAISYYAYPAWPTPRPRSAPATCTAPCTWRIWRWRPTPITSARCRSNAKRSKRSRTAP